MKEKYLVRTKAQVERVVIIESWQIAACELPLDVEYTKVFDSEAEVLHFLYHLKLTYAKGAGE